MNVIAETSDIDTALSFQPKIIRSNRRQSLAIEVKYGEVIIRAPSQLPQAVINKFLKSRENWVQKVLDSGVSQPKQTFSHDSKIYVDGSLVLVCFLEGKAKCELVANELIVSIPNNVINRDEYAFKLFNSWLKERAVEVIHQMVGQVAIQAGLHHRVAAVDFKYTKSKWGHCTSKGHIQINPRILMAPIEVQHYLIAHEVSHLKWMNHSSDFWKLVAILDPNFKNHRKWLQAHQHETLALSLAYEHLPSDS